MKQSGIREFCIHWCPDFGKILLNILIIGIPIAMMIEAESLLEYRYAESRLFNGHYVLSRRNWNGLLVDNYGNLNDE